MKYTICLSMIVKNEAHVIEKTLKQIIKYIPLTYIVICDTGSTDNTINIINDFLKDSNIPGEVHEHEWVDFATNRNLALDISRTKADYSFIFDADDIFHVDKGKIDFPDELKHDFYRFKFDKKLTYMRPLLINNKKNIKWYGVVHEALKPNEPIAVCNVIGNYYIESGHTGDRSSNEFKYLKDAYTIEKEIKRIENKGVYSEENYNDDEKWLLGRYYFYCAQSYNDYSNRDLIFKPKSIEYYKKALYYNNKEYKETLYNEKYFSCYKLYKFENDIKYLIESFKYDHNARLECLIEYIIYLYKNENYKIIKDLYYKFKNYHQHKNFLNTDSLYILEDYYNYKLEYLYSLTADHLKDYEEGLLCCNLCIQNNIKLEDCKRNAEIYKIKLNKNVTKIDSNKVLFFTLFQNENINYTYAKNNAVGGSETAFYNMAKQFAKLLPDKQIIIGGNIIEEEVKINETITIKCININNLKELLTVYKFDTIIISRYLQFFELFSNYKTNNLILYQHDVAFHPTSHSYNLLKNNINNIDYIINLTEWQKNNTIKIYDFLSNYENKIKIINNGLNLKLLSQFENNIKIKNSFIYTSRPERGLKKLLELWKDIKIHIPDATLKISCYIELDQQYLNIINNLKDITFIGSLDKYDLYNEISKTEYWLYPTDFKETSCITAMEMLALKVICIYYPIAGLNDTLGKYGVKTKEGNEIKTILNLNCDIKNNLKNNGYNYSKTLSWNTQATKLLKLIR